MVGRLGRWDKAGRKVAGGGHPGLVTSGLWVPCLHLHLQASGADVHSSAMTKVMNLALVIVSGIITPGVCYFFTQ